MASNFQTTTDAIPTDTIRQLLAELKPTKTARRRCGGRMLKRAVMNAAFKAGQEFYLPTSQFVEIAEAAGFVAKPRLPLRADQPVRGWSIGVTPRSLDAFLRRHQVFPF